MGHNNILKLKNRTSFRNWLKKNSNKELECFIEVKRGRPVDNKHFWYIDAVEEALCFGWIDSTVTTINGKKMQRFGPRKKKSLWSELNKERARRLIKLGLMKEPGFKALPNLNNKHVKIDECIKAELEKAKCLTTFKSFPPLYQRIRIYNVMFYKKRDKKMYNAALKNLIKHTKIGKMYGEWNDYGRLIEY